MSIATVVTRGYGSFGTIPFVVRRGYTAAVAAVVRVANTLFMRFNGPDGGTTFTDSSPAAHGNATAHGNAQIDTAFRKCGSGSLLLDGSGDYASYADDDDWTLGQDNFTLAGWVRFADSTIELRSPLTAAIDEATEDSNTKFLCHFNDSDGSTTFSDSSAAAHGNATVNGNAQIDTAQSKFGGASGLFDGTGDYLTWPDHGDWTLGSSDWTIECFVRFNSVAGTQVFASHYDNTGDQRGWFFRFVAGTGLQFAWTIDGAPGGTTTSAAWSPSTGVWYHVVVQRQTFTIRFLVDGVVLDNGLQLIGSATIFNSTSTLTVGAVLSSGATQFFNGWMDELRITVGVHRYRTQHILAHYASTDDQRGWLFRKAAGSFLEFSWSTDGIATSRVAAAWEPLEGTWYFVTAVRDGSTLRLFVDGDQIGTGSIGSDDIFDSTADLEIGVVSDVSPGFEGYFAGWIDDLRINPSALWTGDFAPPPCGIAFEGLRQNVGRMMR